MVSTVTYDLGVQKQSNYAHHFGIISPLCYTCMHINWLEWFIFISIGAPSWDKHT